jgi:hypothetical protein
MKYGPAVGDVGVIGTIRSITRNPLCSCGFFDANVTANGYASAADTIEDSLGVGNGSLSVRGYPASSQNVPDGLCNGDWVTADILEMNGIAYATNLEKL